MSLVKIQHEKLDIMCGRRTKFTWLHIRFGVEGFRVIHERRSVTIFEVKTWQVTRKCRKLRPQRHDDSCL